MQWIVRHQVKIVLHGHMHQPFCAKVSRSLDHKNFHDFWVLGIGSCGVKQDHLGEIGKNTIGLLRFSPRQVTFSVYTIHPVDEPKLHWSIPIPLFTEASGCS